MSITTEIQRINGGKQAIRTLASQKNVNIPSTALIDSYASVLGAQWPDCTFNVNYDGDKIRGKTMKWNQLLPISNVNDDIKYGVTFINNKNGSYKLTGTATGDYAYPIVPITNYLNVSVGDKYLLCVTNLENGSIQAKNDLDQDYFSYIKGVNAGFFTANRDKLRLNIRTFSGEVYNTLCWLFLFNLTTNFGTGNEPVSASDSRVQFLIQRAKDHPDYDAGSLAYSFYKGTKLGEYDYIDTTNNKLVLSGAEVDVSQMSLTRFLFGSNYLFYGTNNDQETNTTNIISADYQTVANITDIPDMSVTGNGGTGKTLWFRDDSCTTVEQFKTKNAGKKVYFKLATPTEIDL